MKNVLILLLAICLVVTLVRCDKNSQDAISQEDQPITVGLEIDGKQSHEVRIK